MITDTIRYVWRALAPAGVALVCTLVLLSPAEAAAKSSRAVVVELFTSQGCSSCPPADKFLGELKSRDDVIALTLPVDYWDYLGWKDTFASPTNSKRQQAYAGRRRDHQVFTPQMVLNGRISTIGSMRAKVERAIAKERNDMARQWVPVSLTSGEDTIVVSAGVRPDKLKTRKASLWLLLTNNKQTVSIGRGENRNKTVTYHNVVRQMVPIGTWTGEAITIKLSKRDLMIDSYDACTVLLQADGSGPVIGAAHLASDQLDN